MMKMTSTTTKKNYPLQQEHRNSIRSLSSDPKNHNGGNTKEEQEQRQAVVVEKDFVYNVCKDALEGVMLKIGAKGLTFEEISMGTDSFEDISQILNILPGKISMIDQGINVSSLPFLTSFFAGGYIPGQTSFNSEIETKVSWAQAACVCRNDKCTETVAVDPVGFFDVGSGFLRGRSPIAFVGDDEDSLLPCLQQPKLPSFEELELESENCSWTEKSTNLCAELREGQNSTFAVPNLHNRRCVECFTDEGIDGLRITHKGKLVARALQASEILSSEFENPHLTMDDLLHQIEFPQIEWTIDMPFPVPDKTFDFTDRAKNFAFGGITKTFNGLLGAVSPRDFNSTKEGMAASNASIADITRVVDSFYHTQIGYFSTLGQVGILEKMESLPIHLTKQVERSEASPPEEIASGMALLLLASCGFGAILGSFLKKNKGKYFRSFPALLAVFGAFLVLLLEVFAFFFGWWAEIEHHQFNEAFVHTEVKGSRRFTVNPFGNFDMKGAPFVVQTYMVELSDAGENWEWLYIVGMVTSATALVLSAIFGPIFEGDDDDEEEKEEAADNKEDMSKERGEARGTKTAFSIDDNWDEDYDDDEEALHHTNSRSSL